MKRRLLKYIGKVESIIAGEGSAEKDRAALKDLLIQIGFFQHERLIHLLVTLSFALFFVAGVLFFSIYPNIAVLALNLLFLVLLVPYIRHYYLLENGTQRLYFLYDKLYQRFKEEEKAGNP